MEMALRDGEYIADSGTLEGAEALLQRVLFRLTARRGRFPLLPALGSRLYALGQERGAKRLSAARQYVAEALAEEAVTVTAVTLSEAGDGRLRLAVELLSGEGDSLTANLVI